MINFNLITYLKPRIVLMSVLIVVLFSGCSFFIAKRIKPAEKILLKDKVVNYDVNGAYFCYSNETNQVRLYKRRTLIKEIGQNDAPKSKNNFLNYTFGNAGLVAVTETGGIFVQDILLENSARPANNKNYNEFYDEKDTLKTKILYIDKNNVINKCYNSIKGNDVFIGHIQNFVCDSQGRLFAVFKYDKSWRVVRFKNLEVDFSISDRDINMIDKIKDVEYNGRIQSVFPSHDGDYLIIAIAYYSGVVLKYVKIIKYDIEKLIVTGSIKKFKNLNLFLFGTLKGGNFLTWTTIDANLMILKKYSLKGKMQKKYEMMLNAPASAWKYFRVSSDGILYSLYSNSEVIVYEWL